MNRFVSCPICQLYFVFDDYMQHVSTCYYDACVLFKIVPLCTCRGCMGQQSPPSSDSATQPSKRQMLEEPQNSKTVIMSIPKQILSLILAYFQSNEESFFVGLVCKQWNSLIHRNRSITLSAVMAHYCSFGSIPALQLILKMSIKPKFTAKSFTSRGDVLCRSAARYGHLPLLTWAINQIEQEKKGVILPTSNYSICSSAASGGHLDILHWAKQNGFMFDGDTCANAAAGGHLEALKWVRAHGGSWDERTCMNAAAGGHLEVLEWAVANECPFNSVEVSRIAVVNGHVPILEWIKGNGQKTIASLCSIAAWSGRFNVLKWAMSNNIEWDENIVYFAQQNGYKDVAKWIENGCPWAVIND